ncbi:MAG: adenylate/guanylate cyclase domain-containing protein [Gammaproteobacteria bacterium]
MNDRLPRKLTAILYADVAGYSRLTGEDEDRTHRTLSEYLDLISSGIQSQGGEVMHYAGDAILARFGAAVDALSCAVAIQNEINTLNQDVDDDRKLQFRIGVNLGDVIEDRGDIYGDGVNVAARLESLAEPGGICISESMRLALGSKLPLEFECMGEQEVKNIAEPVMAYRAANQDSRIPAAARHNPIPAKILEKPSVAVLPFVNMSDDAEQEYFSDGITEDIITGLSRFREICVIARGSSFAFKDRSADVTEAAKELGAQYVLEGSVRKSANRVRITAQLIDGTSGNHLWAENYDRVLEDVFAVQDDVAQTIISTLVGRLEEESRERASRKSASNLSAYDYFLRGKHCWPDWRGSKDMKLQARKMFEKAMELDPEYAAAYIGLAESYMAEFWSSWTTDRDAAGVRAFEYARKAVELDKRDSHAHLILASVYLYVKSNYELAEAQIQRALELNPNDYWNYCLKSKVSMCTGDFEDSIFCGNEAIRRNPFLPDDCLHGMGFSEYFAQRYDNAIKTFGRLSAPGVEVQGCIAACYAQLGRDEDASAAVSEFRDRVSAEPGSQRDWDAESWRDYWSGIYNFKGPEQLESLLEGLRKAGLPE